MSEEDKRETPQRASEQVFAISALNKTVGSFLAASARAKAAPTSKAFYQTAKAFTLKDLSLLKKHELLQEGYLYPEKAAILLEYAPSFKLTNSQVLGIAACHKPLFEANLAKIKILDKKDLISIMRHERVVAHVLATDELRDKISLAEWAKLLKQYPNCISTFLSKLDLKNLKPSELLMLMKIHKTAAAYIITVPALIGKLSADELNTLCVHYVAHVEIIRAIVVMVSLDKLKKINFYQLASSNLEVALFLVSSQFRDRISPTQWRILFTAHPSLAAVAIKDPSWKIFKNPHDLSILACRDVKLACAVVESQNTKKWYEFDKFSVEDWKRMALSSPEVANQILMSPAGDKFAPKDLMNIAARHPLTAATILLRFSAKFEDDAVSLNKLKIAASAYKTDFFKEKRDDKVSLSAGEPEVPKCTENSP